MCDYIKSDGTSVDVTNGEGLVCQGTVKVIIDADVLKTVTNVMPVSDIC
jgi:hypothetical protein